MLNGLLVALMLNLGGRMAPQSSGRTPAGTGFHCRVGENDRSLSVFAVTDTGLARIGSLPLPAVPREWEVATRWLDRDMDGDSLPEFLVARGNRLWEFKWLDSAFALVATPPLPDTSAWIEDFVFGDVNRDGVEEMIVAAGAHRPESAYDIASALFVCRWSIDSLRTLWTDKGRFGLECASYVTPPDRLIGVYDVRNIGRPELLYQITESSMAPCTYVCYDWRDSVLVESRSFRLDENSLFAESVPDSDRFHYVLEIRPFVRNGMTMLSANSVGEESDTGRRPILNQVIELHGDTIVSAKTLSAAEGRQ